MTPPLKFGPKARKKIWGGFSVPPKKSPLWPEKNFRRLMPARNFFYQGGSQYKKALYGQKKKFRPAHAGEIFFLGSSVLDPGVGADPPAPPKFFFYDPPLTFFFMTPLAFWTAPTYGQYIK